MMYTYTTKKGTVTIAKDGKSFHVLFAGQDLGTYATAELAADDVAGGHTFSAGVDFEKLGVRCDLSEWKMIP